MRSMVTRERCSSRGRRRRIPGIGRGVAAPAGVIGAALLISGCAPERIPDAFAPTSAFDEYRNALEAIDVPESAIPAAGPPAVTGEEGFQPLPVSDRLVLDARERALVTVPFRTEDPGWVEVSVRTDPEGVVEIVDLFRLDGETLRHVASAPEEELRLRFESRRGAEYVLRLVPELLRAGVARIEVQAEGE
ncbi:MAG: hypothetical protein ACLFO1_02385 [Spirochaetaceae bacterium]